MEFDGGLWIDADEGAPTETLAPDDDEVDVADPEAAAAEHPLELHDVEAEDGALEIT